MHDPPKAKTQGVLPERVDDELVVYDQVSHTAHCLSSEVALVWEHCDGLRSQSELARALSLAPAAVERAVDALGECGLLDDVAVVAEHGYSRREAAVRVARAGGAAFAAPLIYSVAVPSMAAALSPNPPCKTQPPGCPGLTTGTTPVGNPVSSCTNLVACLLSDQTCGNFINSTCCYGICAWTGTGICGGSGATYICSTQYRCVRRGGSCPSSTTATCGPAGNSKCCSPNGKPLACSTGTGANFGCCSGQCSGNKCT
jgi:biotin operon repressor